MAGLDVHQFISSHRTKLNEEKIRIQERAPRGILPSGTQASEQSAMLRREREAEYKEYMKNREEMGPVKSRSISEIRRQMAQDRDNEFSSRSDTSLAREGGRNFDYDSLKERKLAEERRYRGSEYGRQSRSDDKPSVSFKEDHYKPTAKDGNWDSEEKDLVSWAHQQHSTRRGPHSSQRSISAPTPPTAGGITALGERENDLELKRNRQREYADSLKAQMREKEKNRIEPQMKSSHRQASPEPSKETRYQPEPSRVSPRKRYEPDHKEPSKEQHYPPYSSMYPHYPPPPPPHSYYMPSYYGPPPPPHRDMYYPPEKPDPYRYPYYPPQDYGSQYVPPHVPTHSGRRYDDSNRRFDDSRRRFDDWKDSRSSRREPVSETRTSGERKKDDSFTSPIHGDLTKASKPDKNSYRKELEKQMKEKKERDLKAKIEREKYEQKKENEIYDPFGKGGCGAPVRDQHGNLVADLKRMKRINDERTGLSPRHSQEFMKTEDSPVRKSAETTPQHKTILTYNKLDDETHKKNDQESYRDYLRRQVQEKEDRKQKEKEAKRLEEQKELERIEKDRMKLDNDLRNERERERLTEVELKRTNEQLKKEAEMERRELIIKQKEELHKAQLQEKLLEEQRKQELAEKMAQPIQQYRSRSPPIPTLRKQSQQGGNTPQPTTAMSPQLSHPLPPTSPPVPTVQKQQMKQSSSTQQAQSSNVFQAQSTTSQYIQSASTQQMPAQNRSLSPPVPTIQRKQANPAPPPAQQAAPQIQQSIEPVTTAPATESTILSQLAAMRMHLQAQLAEQIKTGTVQPQLQQLQAGAIHQPFQAGIVQRTGAIPPPSQAPQHTVLQHTTAAPKSTAGPRVRQPQNAPSSTNLDKFASLKYKSPFPNQEFLNQFPNPPRSESALEVQQGAMLRYQEERLARLRQRGKDKETRPTIGGLLPSTTQGVPLSLAADPFHEDTQSNLLSVPRSRVNGRNTSPGGQSQFSIATVDVDGMAGRNEERMRRLDAILNARTATRSVRGVESGYEPSGAGGYEPSGGGVRGGYEPSGAVGRVNLGEDSESIISNFLKRDSHGHTRPSVTRGSEKSLDCETVYQRLGTPST